jgi:hypothetical protein
MHHYFRVFFKCKPGGSYRDGSLVVGTLDEVKEVVEADLNSSWGAYLALLYGEELVMEAWEDGRQVARFDLHPLITYRLSDREEPIRFAGIGDDAALDIGEEQALCEALGVDGTVTATATVDWDRLPPLALEGTPLPKDTPARFEDGEESPYGFDEGY